MLRVHVVKALSELQPRYSFNIEGGGLNNDNDDAANIKKLMTSQRVKTAW